MLPYANNEMITSKVNQFKYKSAFIEFILVKFNHFQVYSMEFFAKKFI